MAQDFWELKRQQLQQQGKLPQPRQEPVKYKGAWWAEETETETLVHGPTREQQVIQDSNHDFSKAQHLRSNAGNCPNCGSGNYVSPSASSANRCFDCGYIAGREVNNLDTFSVAADVRTVQVRQASSTQGLRIGTSAAEINAANARLIQSEHGKAKIDS